MDVTIKTIRPQEGYQMKALSSPADIVIGGGAAGAGKTFSLLLDPLKHISNKDFGGVIFRRTSPQIKVEGGLWDTSFSLYNAIGATPKESNSSWEFPSGAKMKFNHLEYEKNILDWQGAQIPFIGFDELTHFTKKMFFYLLSRNRSTCGIKPYVRATCNPDPESWVAEFISWWIDPDTGNPIPERDAVVRYFIRDGNNYIWGNSKEECIENGAYLIKDVIEKSGISPDILVKSATFISGDIYGNKELLKVNPEYLGNLLSQDNETKAQLLEGNWKIRISDIDLFDYYKFLDIHTNTGVKETGVKRITADIALKGSDKMVVFVWDGFVVIDVVILDKSNGKQVIEAIERLAKLHKVQNKNIAFDNDGVGGFIDGFIEGAVEFKNGAAAMNGENYANLKTQCYYKLSDRIKRGEVLISEHVGSQMYDNKRTIKQQLEFERKAIKRDKPDHDGKLKIISKAEMKIKLGGMSPDLLDALMMVEIFELKPEVKIYTTEESAGDLGF